MTGKLLRKGEHREFDCVECGRHIVKIIDPYPDLCLCVHCVFTPGWFRDETLRLCFDPTHDGKDRCELPLRQD